MASVAYINVTPTRQTDEQANGQTTYNGITRNVANAVKWCV